MFLVSVTAPFRSLTVRDAARSHTSRSIVALCSLKRHSSTAEVGTNPHPLHSLLHQASLPCVASAASTTDHRGIGFSVAGLTLQSSTDHRDLVRMMLTGNQRRLLRLLLRLIGTYCLLHALPLIFLELC